MWKKHLNSLDRVWPLATIAGVLVFLSFECFRIFPLIFLFPIFLNALAARSKSGRQAFGMGFFTSFVIMLGGFYWVVYVLHEFGYLPWAVAFLLYLVFCGFGALNFPLFTYCAYHLKKRTKASQNDLVFTTALTLPALFTLIEWAIPKLFPWYISHSLYRQLWMIQIAEITGETFLTFAIYSFGSVLGLYLFPPTAKFKVPKTIWIVPGMLWAVCIGFSLYRLYVSPPDSSGRKLSVAMIQANIGSLEKVAAEKGIGQRVAYVVNKYRQLTEDTLKKEPADLVLWPETAMPFQMESDKAYPVMVKGFIREMNTAFIIGGYEQSPKNFYRDYNSAFLFEPNDSAKFGLRMESYQKNILLAFGEYLPLGDRFPSLYRRFPQVSDFERGTTQNPFTLKDGTRLGVTICYESIVPRFYRKVANQGVNAVINLTNDSWFGPTSEPFLHAQLTPFRAIEHRVPLFRSTNTGISFSVDVTGKMSETTPVYAPSVLRTTLSLPKEPPRTFYGLAGDWFIIFCVVFLSLEIFWSLSPKRK